MRETFEETGFTFGGANGLDLSCLRYFARAITPPGRTRRFDSRFFVADAHHLANIDRPSHAGSGELLEPRWFTFAEAEALDLPTITRTILGRLSSALAASAVMSPGAPVWFHYQKGKIWREEML